MSDTDLVMYRGDDRSFTMTVTDNGGPLDLAGATVRFTAKRKLADADDDAVIALDSGTGGVVITDAPGGVVRVDVGSADTAGLTKDEKLFWDLQVKDAAGKVRTSPDASLTATTLGTLRVRVDVTRTTD